MAKEPSRVSEYLTKEYEKLCIDTHMYFPGEESHNFYQRTMGDGPLHDPKRIKIKSNTESQSIQEVTSTLMTSVMFLRAISHQKLLVSYCWLQLKQPNFLSVDVALAHIFPLYK